MRVSTLELLAHQSAITRIQYCRSDHTWKYIPGWDSVTHRRHAHTLMMLPNFQNRSFRLLAINLWGALRYLKPASLYQTPASVSCISGWSHSYTWRLPFMRSPFACFGTCIYHQVSVCNGDASSRTIAHPSRYHDVQYEPSQCRIITGCIPQFT